MVETKVEESRPKRKIACMRNVYEHRIFSVDFDTRSGSLASSTVDICYFAVEAGPAIEERLFMIWMLIWKVNCQYDPDGVSFFSTTCRFRILGSACGSGGLSLLRLDSAFLTPMLFDRVLGRGFLCCQDEIRKYGVCACCLWVFCLSVTWIC